MMRQKDDPVTFVSYRLIESGREQTAFIGATNDTDFAAVTAHEVAKVIAGAHGIPVADVELCGTWGERLKREMT